MKKYLFGCAGLLFSISSFPQKFSASLDLQMSVPQGEYKTVNKDAGIGGRANLFYRPKKDIPVKLGIELGMQVKGSTHQYFSGYIGGYYDDFRVSASNNIVSLLMAVRLQPENHGRIKPFVDAIAGWNVFFSTVKVEQLTFFSAYNSTYSNSSKGRWAFTYGPAAGVDIPLSKRDDLGLELKCAYLFGSNTSYLTNPQIAGDGRVFFDQQRSETTMIIPQVGIRIMIQ